MATNACLTSLTLVFLALSLTANGLRTPSNVFSSHHLQSHRDSRVTFTLTDPTKPCARPACLFTHPAIAGPRTSPATFNKASTQAYCTVPTAMSMHPGTVTARIMCNSEVAAPEVNIVIFSSLEVSNIKRASICDHEFCSVFITVVTDLPATTLDASTTTWSVTCGDDSEWMYLDTQSVTANKDGSATARLGFGVVPSAKGQAFPACTLTLDKASMTHVPLVAFESLMNLPTLSSAATTLTAGSSEEEQDDDEVNRRSLLIQGGLYGSNGGYGTYSAAYGYGGYGGNLGFGPSNNNVLITGSSEYNGALVFCKVAIDYAYVPVSATNSMVDTSYEAGTVATTDAYGEFNITNVPANTYYSAILRVLPAADLASPRSSEPKITTGDTNTCYDATNLRRLDMYMNAPLNYTVISMLSTVVAELISQGMTQTAAEALVKSALGIDATINLAVVSPYDEFGIKAKATVLSLARAEGQLGAFVSAMASFMSGGKTTPADRIQSKAYMVYVLAAQLKAASVGRKLLAGTFDLTSVTTLRALVTAATNAMTSAAASSLGTGVADPALVTAAVTAVSNMQTVITGLTNNVQLLQSVYINDATLAQALTDLVTGAITPADFAASTTTTALLQASLTTPVPGQIVPNPCATGTVPVWSSPCMSPDPFSCMTAGVAVNPGSDCVLPPNWDITRAQLAFSYQWNLATINAATTGSFFTLYQYQLGQSLPAGSWEVQFLRSSYVPITLELGHTGASSEIVLATTSSVAVNNPITYITFSMNPGPAIMSESAALVMRFLGAPRPNPDVVVCAPTQTALIFSTCLTPGNSPATCGPNTFNKCVNSPNIDLATNRLAFATTFPDTWTLPAGMFQTSYYATIYQFDVSQLRSGIYFLEFLANQIPLTVTFTTPAGLTISYSSTTTTVTIPAGGVSTVTITFNPTAMSSGQSAGFNMWWVSVIPPPPTPAPNGGSTSTNTIVVTLTVSAAVQSDVNALATLMNALRAAFAAYFGVSNGQVLIVNTIFLPQGTTGRRSLLALDSSSSSSRKLSAMLPAPPMPPAPPPVQPSLQVTISLVAPIERGDTFTQAAIDAAIASIMMDPSTAIPTTLVNTWEIPSSSIVITSLPSPPAPPAAPFPETPAGRPPSPNPSPMPSPPPRPPSPAPSPFPSPPKPLPPSPAPPSPKPSPPAMVLSPSPSPMIVTAAAPPPPPPGNAIINAGPTSDSSDNKAAVIAPAVIIPVVVVGAAVGFAAWWYKKKKAASITV